MRAYEFINETTEVDEQSPKANAYALVGSGRGGGTKKPGTDSAAHKKVRPPGTNYDKLGRPYKTGATPGSVG